MHSHLTDADLLASVGELERTAMSWEQLAGLVPAGTTRPMFPWERKSGANFAQMDRELNAAQSQTSASLDQVRDVIIAALVAAIAGADSEDAAAAALNRFAAAQPKDVRDAIKAAAGQIHGTLDQLYATGADEVVREAAQQGVPAPDALQEGLSAPPDQFKSIAGSAPSTLWTTLVGVALAVGGVRAAAAADIVSAVRDKNLAGAYDLARQATNLAHGQGRNDAVKQMPEPASVYSSELLDGSTCEPCADLDGYEYPDLETGLQDYPDGRYIYCDGGDRCRGTLVVVYAEADTSADPGADDDLYALN